MKQMKKIIDIDCLIMVFMVLLLSLKINVEKDIDRHEFRLFIYENLIPFCVKKNPFQLIYALLICLKMDSPGIQGESIERITNN